MCSDTRNHVYLIFLAAVLRNVKTVNLLFQSQTADPLKLFQELEDLYIDVLKQILKPAVLRHNSNSDLLSLDLKNMDSIYLDKQTSEQHLQNGSEQVDYLPRSRPALESSASISCRN